MDLRNSWTSDDRNAESKSFTGSILPVCSVFGLAFRPDSDQTFSLREQDPRKYLIGLLQLRANAADNQCRVNERKEVPHVSRANPRIGHGVCNLCDGLAGCGGRPAG